MGTNELKIINDIPLYSSYLCRDYFKKSGLQSDIFYSTNEYYKLSEFIQKEIQVLLSDKSYSMIKNLKMHPKIKFSKDCVRLLTSGYYFKKREAITFNLDTELISFCGWASGCNRIPFVKGFIKWCDYMQKNERRDKIKWT